MKKLGLVLLGLVFGLTLFLGVAMAADKLAYVDLSRLFSEYAKTKDYDKVLSDKQTVYEAERDKKVNEVKQLQDKINMLSDKEKEGKKTELENKVRALQDFDRQKQTDLRKGQDEKMKEILKDIEESVKKYAEKEGYTMVFNDRVLVYEAKNMDITDKVLDILQKGYKK
jgi:Skp family chaperone for outer membrane proteins